jgi:hypothetical protein
MVMLTCIENNPVLKIKVANICKKIKKKKKKKKKKEEEEEVEEEGK